jgi:hypothetical protein
MHGANEKTEHTPKVVHLFFLLRWRVGWCEDGKQNLSCSHYVLIFKFQEDNIGQSILDKMRCYWEHVEEHLPSLGNMFITQSIGNIMRTSCEHVKNKIIQKIQTPTHTFPKRIKTGIFGACCNSSLAEQKFQLCSSPILAWADSTNFVDRVTCNLSGLC